MAEFFGTVQGGRGKATRLGHGSTGLHVTAQSYEGSIVVDLFWNNEHDTNWCSIMIAEGSKGHGTHELYRGPIKNLFTDQHCNLGR